MRIEWTAPAEADLRVLFDYIARDSAASAERFIDRILESVGKLADHPQMGRSVPETDSRDIRELIFRKSYRIIYAVRDDRILVLAIVHTSRDMEGTLTKPWDVV
ncbi:type II toxin-antitoxin system RelE/ParE family toxin [Lentisalinibacter salinarum]|uniref:type II toxin-antitoxin system RelE/ParE family toxin n=1 Tax=Lentisalinibacter salinarum TaxID=2992239 RepID=UPI00386D3FC9